MEPPWNKFTSQTATKHKKTLTEMFSPAIAPNFKILHSPSFVQTKKSFHQNTSKISDNDNLSKTNMEKFINNFYTFHGTPKKVMKMENLNIPSKKKTLSQNNLNSKQIQTENDEKIREIYGENLNIILPDDFKSKKNNDSFGFKSFASLLKDDYLKSLNLSPTCSVSNFINKQLHHNDSETKYLKTTLTELQKENYTKIIKEAKKKFQVDTNLLKRTVKYKRNFSVNTNIMSSDFDFLEINEEKHEFFYRFFVKELISQDSFNKPTVRESSSLILVNQKAYLFAGLSTKLLNTMHELDLSNNFYNSSLSKRIS